MKFQGILTALVTPMDEQFQVDEAKLRQLVNIQIDSGIHGLVMLGGHRRVRSLICRGATAGCPDCQGRGCRACPRGGRRLGAWLWRMLEGLQSL